MDRALPLSRDRSPLFWEWDERQDIKIWYLYSLAFQVSWHILMSCLKSLAGLLRDLQETWKRFETRHREIWDKASWDLRQGIVRFETRHREIWDKTSRYAKRLGMQESWNARDLECKRLGMQETWNARDLESVVPLSDKSNATDSFTRDMSRRVSSLWQGSFATETCNFQEPTNYWCATWPMGWLRLAGSLKLQVSFAEYRLFSRALLQKRPIILRSLLVEGTP